MVAGNCDDGLEFVERINKRKTQTDIPKVNRNKTAKKHIQQVTMKTLTLKETITTYVDMPLLRGD